MALRPVCAWARATCHYHVRRGYVRLYESWFDSMSRWFDHELRPTWLWLPRPFPLVRQAPAVQVRRFTFMGEREVPYPCVGRCENGDVCSLGTSRVSLKENTLPAPSPSLGGSTIHTNLREDSNLGRKTPDWHLCLSGGLAGHNAYDPWNCD